MFNIDARYYNALIAGEDDSNVDYVQQFCRREAHLHREWVGDKREFMDHCMMEYKDYVEDAPENDFEYAMEFCVDHRQCRPPPPPLEEETI